jgi:hypothetical protein
MSPFFVKVLLVYSVIFGRGGVVMGRCFLHPRSGVLGMMATSLLSRLGIVQLFFAHELYLIFRWECFVVAPHILIVFINYCMVVALFIKRDDSLSRENSGWGGGSGVLAPRSICSIFWNTYFKMSKTLERATCPQSLCTINQCVMWRV